MTLQSDVGLHRETLFGTNPARSQMVYGVDASRGQLQIALERVEPAISAEGRCGKALATSPKSSSGKTYFIFDAPPGKYRVTSNVEPVVNFIVPVGKQVYIGDFVYAGEFTVLAGQSAQDAARNRPVAFIRDIETAKLALGRRGTALELAEMEEGNPMYISGFYCKP